MRKSTKNIIIAVFITLSIVLAALVGILIYRIVTKDSDDAKVVNSNGVQDDETGNQGGDSGDVIVDYEEGTRTIMVYMIGSDLETDSAMGTCDIKEMMEAEFGDNIRIVIQTGGALNWHNNYIKDGEVQRSEIKSGKFIKLESLGKVNMALGDTLTEFIEYAREEYPAEKYTLVMWDHGGSAPISFGVDEIFNTSLMTDAQIGEAIADAGVMFESIIMDACNMCTLEMAMAIKDNADYFVAAESAVTGTGLYYTDWISRLGEDVDITPREYGELIIEDYMETTEKMNSAASMSCIDLSKIEDVYEAYEAYIECVYDDIKDGAFAEYTLARKRSGLYSGTDSVDLITLAKKYRTDESNKLISAVREVVCYTESDYTYGKGLAVYSPNSEIDKYNEVRESLSTLGYEDEMIQFYDALVSIKYAYMGDQFVESYAGEWYDEEIVRTYDIKPSEEEKELNTQKVNGQDVICLSEDEWDIVTSVEQMLIVMMDEKTAITFGQTRYDNVDDNGNIILEKPEYWITIGGYIAVYVCVDYYEDSESGEWSMYGMSIARCNGKEVALIIQHDNNNPNGKIAGYVLYDFETQTSPDGRARVMYFDEDDEVELIYPVIDADSLTMSYKNVLDETFKPSELTLGSSKIDFGEGNYICSYTIEDIYGNQYETKSFQY